MSNFKIDNQVRLLPGSQTGRIVRIRKMGGKDHYVVRIAALDEKHRYLYYAPVDEAEKHMELIKKDPLDEYLKGGE